MDVATFAGGCFWCLEAPYTHEPGVVGVLAGYMGGHVEHPTYEQVCTETTGHREVVTVWFEPQKVSYQRLLDVFWLQIDPTDPGGQFADRGHQYTTAIYVYSDDQRAMAEDSKEKLEDSGMFDQPIATAIENATLFYPAEDYHQQYYQKEAEHYKRYSIGSGRAGYLEHHPLKRERG